MSHKLLCLAFAICLAPAAESALRAQASLPPPPTWPRKFEKGGDTILMYQPQIDSWKDHTKIEFRSAVVVTPQSGGKPEYGVVTVKGDSIIDENARTVLITNLKADVSFPGVPPDPLEPRGKLVQSLLPASGFVDVSLDQVLAYVHDTSAVPKVKVNLAPPAMFYSDVPAILVMYMGAPQFRPVSGTGLMFAVNTNWVVLMDPSAGQYYLLDGDSWLQAPDPMQGPWTPAKSLPADCSKLPSDGNWAAVAKHVPGTPFNVIPKVFTSASPAELIVTEGPPDYTPLAGTRLMYVSNPAMPLFLDLIDGKYYYLAAGRWFRAAKPSGPWSAASADLPAEFAKIPSSSPVGFVLSAVPNTQEADDAILLATVPHKATIDIATAKVAVTYAGTPKFAPIEGTSMTYAVNTSYQVVLAAGTYYCCYQGVWFQAPAPEGPWTVCASVPAMIYTIPPSSPLYNVTYVRVYDATGSNVVVGYTAGYTGEYVAETGALMFGAGMLVGSSMATTDVWYGYPPCYYSYGCAAHYDYAYGCYCRSGAAYYGPHGGAGWGAAYNPATGTYARGAAAYGPEGAVHGAQAYNPWTNTFAQHTGGTNGYSSWGSSYVQQGNKWAEAGHQSGAYGTTAWAENSAGQSVEAAQGNRGNAVAKTGNDDLYASHDGNVYKNTDGSWQKYQGGGNWGSVPAQKPTPYAGGAGAGNAGGWAQHDQQASLNQDAWSRSLGNNNTASSWGNRSQSFGGGGAGGFSGGGFGGGWGGRGGGRRR